MLLPVKFILVDYYSYKKIIEYWAVFAIWYIIIDTNISNSLLTSAIPFDKSNAL